MEMNEILNKKIDVTNRFIYKDGEFSKRNSPKLEMTVLEFAQMMKNLKDSINDRQVLYEELEAYFNEQMK